MEKLAKWCVFCGFIYIASLLIGKLFLGYTGIQLVVFAALPISLVATFTNFTAFVMKKFCAQAAASTSTMLASITVAQVVLPVPYFFLAIVLIAALTRAWGYSKEINASFSYVSGVMALQFISTLLVIFVANSCNLL